MLVYTVAVVVPRTSVVLIKPASRPICQQETFASVGQLPLRKAHRAASQLPKNILWWKCRVPMMSDGVPSRTVVRNGSLLYVYTVPVSAVSLPSSAPSGLDVRAATKQTSRE